MFRPIACTCSLYLAIQLFSCKYVTIKLSCSISNKKVTYQLNSVLRSPRRDMQRKKLSCAHEIASLSRDAISFPRDAIMLPRAHKIKKFFCMSLRGLRTVSTGFTGSYQGHRPPGIADREFPGIHHSEIPSRNSREF